MRPAEGADRGPVPETAAAHPLTDVEDVLAECREAGLIVDMTPSGPLWGWLRCPAGTRSMTVRADPPDPARHARALRLFLASHFAHHPERKRKRGAR